MFLLPSPINGRCSCGHADFSDIGKHPRTEHGLKDAATDPKTISGWWERWPDANVGIVTGIASGLVAVDVDPRHSGDVTWAELLDIHGAPDTLTTMTGSGGEHWIFDAQAQELRNSTRKIGEGIDTRAEGGYIVAPPSLHLSGQRYEWSSKVKPSPIPEWLRELWPIQNGSKSSPADTAPPGAITEGSRNDYLARLAGAARRRGASEEGIQCLLQAENSVRCDPLLDATEVENIALSISRYEAPKLSLNGHPPDTPPLDHSGWDVVAERPIIEGKTVHFRAQDIRKERTGVHAKIEALFNGIPLGWDVFNIDRLRDRHDLARKCHARLNKIWENGIDQEVFGSYLDEFCRDLWVARLKELSATRLVGNPDIPVDMVLWHYIIGGGGTIIFAPPGRGKSLIGLLMATSVDAGVSDIWDVPVPRKVLFVNLERSAASIQRRLGLVNIALGLEPDRSLLVLNARGKSLSDIWYVVESAIREHGVEVLFLDSISRSGQGSLLDDRAVNHTIDSLNNLCPTWLAIGHTPRGDEAHLFGSLHFEAGADLIVRLATEYSDNRLGIGLKVDKSNDTPKPPIQQLALEFDQFGLSGVRAAQRGEVQELTTSSQSQSQQLIDIVLEEGKTTLANAHKFTGIPKATLSRLFNQSDKFVRFGRARMWSSGLKHGTANRSKPFQYEMSFQLFQGQYGVVSENRSKHRSIDMNGLERPTPLITVPKTV